MVCRGVYRIGTIKNALDIEAKFFRGVSHKFYTMSCEKNVT